MSQNDSLRRMLPKIEQTLRRRYQEALTEWALSELRNRAKGPMDVIVEAQGPYRYYPSFSRRNVRLACLVESGVRRHKPYHWENRYQISRQSLSRSLPYPADATLGYYEKGQCLQVEDVVRWSRWTNLVTGQMGVLEEDIYPLVDMLEDLRLQRKSYSFGVAATARLEFPGRKGTYLTILEPFLIGHES